MRTNEKKISEKNSLSVKRMIESVVGCKWSLSVLEMVRSGINRPGAMEREIEGLTTKVLNDRLKKLVRFGVLERTVFAEVPPHVEYNLTDFGNKFVEILKKIESLEFDLLKNNDESTTSVTF